MLFEQRGGKRVGMAAAGREYVIGYALGARRPWVVEDDDSRHTTLEEAEARVHEIEAVRTGEH